MNSQISNPYSTGGGGTTFEQLVGVSYLVSLLAGDIPRGMDEGICDQVGFQRRWNDALLDDIVITTRSSDGKTRKLMLQVKHDIAISRSKANRVFKRVMSDCWETFEGRRGSFNPATDRLGIAVGVYHGSVDRHLQSLLQWARTSQSIEDFGRVKVQNFASAEMRDYLDIFSKTLEWANAGKIQEQQIWQFLGCFVFMYFDIENEGSSTQNYVKIRAREQLTGQDTHEVTNLLNSLRNLVSEYAKSGGQLDAVSLRQRLSGFGLKDRSDCTRDLGRLRKVSDRTLGRITDTIGQRVHIPRSNLVSHAIEAITSNQVVFVTGEPGTGKSVLLKKIAELLRQEGEIFAIGMDDLSGANFEEFASNLHLEHDFQLILSAFQAAPIRCLLVDGLEQILHEYQRRRVLYDLLHEIQTYNSAIPETEHSSKWHFVAACRSEQFYDVLVLLRNSINLTTDKRIMVPPLESNDLEAIENEFPALGHLSKQQHIQEIIRTPFVLDFLTFPELQLVDLPKTNLLTETWLIELYWKQVVRNSETMDQQSGNPDTRETTVISIGKHRLRNGRKWVNASEVDTEVIGALVRDRVFRLEDARVSFAHETLDDWTVTRILLSNWDQLPTFIEEFEQSLDLLRPMRLLALRELELKQAPNRWLELLSMLENHEQLADRWYQTVLLAPLSSPKLADILTLIRPLLFDNSGRLLGNFMRALRTYHTVPSHAILQLLQGTNLPNTEVEKNLALSREPVAEPWVLVWNLLMRDNEILPKQALSEIAEAATLWMKSAEIPLRKEVGLLCSDILNREFRAQNADNSLGTFDLTYSEQATIDRRVARQLQLAILHGADCIPQTVRSLLHDLLETDEEYLAEMLFGRHSAVNWLPVAKHMPETFADITLRLFCDTTESKVDKYGGSSLDLRDWQIRLKHDYIWRFPNDFRTDAPFYGFLKLNFYEGIRLIIELVNCATNKWLEKNRGIRGARPLPQRIRLPDGDRELWGNSEVYNWCYDTPTHTIPLALTSLRYWLTEQLQNRGPEDVSRFFDMILRQSDSVALVAVCVLVALEDIHTRAASLIPVLANPAFWELDLTRHVQSIMIDRSAESSTFVQIIPIILFTGQPEARETLMTAMRSFPKNIPFFYEEELADDEIIVQRREYMEQLATFADSENYTLEEQDGVIRVHFNYPPEIENRLKKERGALETSFRSTRLTALAYSIDSNRQTDESIFVQALESEIEMENLLTSQSDKESGAVAELCAALVRKHPAWLKENGYWGWCRQKLFEAVRFHDPETGLPNPILGSLHLVAVALPSLIKNDPTDREAHELIWDLIVTAQPYPSDEAVSKLFTAIDCLWDSAPDFLWQTYNLLATRAEWLAARGSDATSPDHAVEEVQIELRAEAPRISQQSIHCAYWLAPLIAAFPRLSKRPQSASDRRILDFVDEVVRFSNKVHRQKKVKDELSQHRFVVPLEWDEPASHLLADWMLHSHFDFACERILEPTLQEWPDSPGALERLLHEVIMMAESSEHKERVIAIWKHVYNRIWPIESSQISHHELRDSARRSTYSAMVLMPEYEALNPWKSRDWNPSANLVPEFQLWVESLAHHQDYWRILIRMLHAIGKPINLPYGVNWLFETLRRCRNPNVLLNDKQVVSALSQLLIDIWHDHDSIRGDQHVFQRFIHIVDLLASRGDQMAVELQKTIEF